MVVSPDGEAAIGDLSDVRTFAPAVPGDARPARQTGAGSRTGDGSPVTAREGPAALRRANDPPGLADPPSERYRLGDVLGLGGMGEVVLAHDVQIGRDVAVKRIRADDPVPDEIARFLREARVQGRLEHPAIAPVHDLAVDAQGRPYFVMKRLTGTTMFALLDTLRAAPAAERAALHRRLLRAFVDVCLAMEFAHSRGVIHRDLKPSNIMLGDFGEVHVLDWGLARASSDPEDAVFEPGVGGARPAFGPGTTLAGTVMGTPGYMAPEQLAGERVGPAADVYALGCVLFEIVAGVPLHVRGRAGDDGDAGARRIARPSVYWPEASPELDAICERATQRDPAERHPSARTLGDAVQAFLDGDRDLARRAQLAQVHLAEARAALALGDDELHRRAAVQGAGRALALDPTASEAADLLTYLLVEPPREVPAAVETELAEIDRESARHHGRVAAVGMVAYLGFLPVLLWTGVRSPGYVVVYVALALAALLHVAWLARRPRIAQLGIYVNAALNAALISVVARMVGPFIIAPSLAVLILTGFAAHPRFGRMWVLAILYTGAIAVPWLCELAGLVASSYRFTADGELVLSSPILRYSPGAVQVAFALLLAVLLALASWLSRGLAHRHRETIRALEMRAWHLHLVVPRTRR